MERAESKTILELLHYAGKQEATSKDAQVVGDRAAQIWQEVLPNERPQKVEQEQHGETITVNTYPREFWPVVLNIILQYYQRKERDTCKPFEGLREHLNERKGKRPRIRRNEPQPVKYGE